MSFFRIAVYRYQCSVARKYTAGGGVMGVVFLRGTEMNRQMYEAMVCRGFTDDYEGL